LLATGKPVAFRQQPDGLHLTLPKQPPGAHAYAYRIALARR
jgi:alpha-L-fucosidase